MNKKANFFGRYLKTFRFKAELSIRDVCRQVNYDPSNWSKIERGKLPPPASKDTLLDWAKVLKVPQAKEQEFIDKAMIAQGYIPDDIISKKEFVNLLPAFFRTLRGNKPTKQEIDNFIKIIKKG